MPRAWEAASWCAPRSARSGAAVPVPAKKPTRDPSAPSKPAATRLAEPEEGGIPMAKAGSRWWESGSAAPGAAGTGTGTGGGLAKDFFVTRAAAPARDFFRSKSSTPFAPRSKSSAKWSKSSAGADANDDEDPEDGDESDGDVEIDVDEIDAFVEDDEGEFEDESSGSEDGEGDSDSGDLDVVDFD